jgi:WD40 repeat protein
VVRIWDLAQGSCRLELTAPALGTTQIVWSKDCFNLAAASPDGTVSVWDLTKESRSCMASYATGTLAVLALHFTGHNLTCVGTAP